MEIKEVLKQAISLIDLEGGGLKESLSKIKDNEEFSLFIKFQMRIGNFDIVGYHELLNTYNFSLDYETYKEVILTFKMNENLHTIKYVKFLFEKENVIKFISDDSVSYHEKEAFIFDLLGESSGNLYKFLEHEAVKYTDEEFMLLLNKTTDTWALIPYSRINSDMIRFMLSKNQKDFISEYIEYGLDWDFDEFVKAVKDEELAFELSLKGYFDK